MPPAEQQHGRTTLSHILALAAALAMVLAMIPLASSGAQSTGETRRLEAQDNIAAAIEFSRLAFPNGANEALLGREDVFADLLSSGAAQGLLGAPLLLTQTDNLSDATLGELERLGATDVSILGGEAAVSRRVENQLRERGYVVNRFAGTTRIETAIDVAETLFPTATTAILARAFGGASDPTQAFADSLAAGGWAAAELYPVLLTESDRLSDSTRDYFRSSVVQQVFVVGGAGAVSDEVITELESMGKTVVRVSGDNRFGTAVAVANERGFATAADTDLVVLIEGQQSNAYASGFAAAAVSAIGNAPIILSNQSDVPVESEEFLSGGDGETSLICGPYVDDAACDEAEEILGTRASPSPSDSGTPTPTASPTGTPTGCATPRIISPLPVPNPTASPSCPPQTQELGQPFIYRFRR